MSIIHNNCNLRVFDDNDFKSFDDNFDIEKGTYINNGEVSTPKRMNSNTATASTKSQIRITEDNGQETEIRILREGNKKEDKRVNSNEIEQVRNRDGGGEGKEKVNTKGRSAFTCPWEAPTLAVYTYGGTYDIIL